MGDGWFRTGDPGIVTSEGYVRYLGRRKEMIKVNGMSVFPTEVESMLGQNPAIAACGAIARPDEKKGQVPIAFITLKPGHKETEENPRAWSEATMAVYKVPEFRIMDALPMTATGKIKKNELEQLL